MNVFACTGGGVRGLSVAGVLQQGDAHQKWQPNSFDAITGDSFGALIAALLANHWSPAEMGNFFIKTPFNQLLTPLPWSIRKPLLVVASISLGKIASFIDSLKLQSSKRLFINTWDAAANQQVIYCEKKPPWAEQLSALPTTWIENAYTTLGFGTVITRSMALPGLQADSLQWMDGGLSEHPPLAFLPKKANTLLINLGYAGLVPRKGDTIPRGLLDRALYAYEVTASIRQRLIIDLFQHCFEIDPQIYDVDSINFGLSPVEKSHLIQRGFENTQRQWRQFKPF